MCDSDSAVAGEAASLAMGLVMLGSGHTEIINKMLEYAHNTDHEKIIRGGCQGNRRVFVGYLLLTSIVM